MSRAPCARARRAVALVTSLTLAVAHPALAACPDDAARQAATMHIAELRAELGEQAHYSRIWSVAWTAGLTAMTLGQAGLTLVTKDPGTRADLWVGAGAALISAVYMFLSPPEVVDDARKFEVLATTAGADKCEVLAEGQRLLLSAAADEENGRGWVTQLLNAALNTAVLLVLGLGFGRWWPSGVVGGVGGELTAEATIYTQPHGLPGFVARARADGWLPPPTHRSRQAARAASGAAPVFSLTLHF